MRSFSQSPFTVFFFIYFIIHSLLFLLLRLQLTQFVLLLVRRDYLRQVYAKSTWLSEKVGFTFKESFFFEFLLCFRMLTFLIFRSFLSPRVFLLAHMIPILSASYEPRLACCVLGLCSHVAWIKFNYYRLKNGDLNYLCTNRVLSWESLSNCVRVCYCYFANRWLRASHICVWLDEI